MQSVTTGLDLDYRTIHLTGRPPIVVDVRRSSRLITIAKNPHETMQGSLSGCVAEVCWVRSLRCPRLVYKFTRARRCLPGPHRTQMRDPYFDILQLAWVITVDFGPAWELACLEKIHLGLAGQQLTRTATYMLNYVLNGPHPGSVRLHICVN